MQHGDFYEAALPEPFTILGLRLKPFSLGHLILLRRLESPFFDDSETEPGFQDLILAVLVCSHTWEECIELVEGDMFPAMAFQLGKQLTEPTWLHRISLKKPRRIDWSEKFKLWADYTKAAMPDQCFAVRGENTGSIHAPGEQVVKLTLMHKLGLNESEVLNRSWALCMEDFLVLKAMDGAVDIYDGEEVETAQETANRMFEKLNKRQRNGEATTSSSEN